MVLEKLRLEDKVAVVTGAGRGIGKYIALAFAEAGADVVVAARTEREIKKTAEEINRLGRKAIFVSMDVRKSKDVQDMVDQAISKFGKIDILVNNAGIATGKSVFEISEEDWHMVIDTNLTGPFLCSKAAGRYMIKRRQGNIINIVSTLAVRGMPERLDYCASKGGLIQMTKALALEWAQYNIRVNAIGPGFFYTPLTASRHDDSGYKSKLLPNIPLRRIGQPDEIGPLAVYLASDASDYMTGETIFIDGGILAKGPFYIEKEYKIE